MYGYNLVKPWKIIMIMDLILELVDLVIDQVELNYLTIIIYYALRHLTINTLRLGQNLPTDAEISVHTTHPLEWEAQYRI